MTTATVKDAPRAPEAVKGQKAGLAVGGAAAAPSAARPANNPFEFMRRFATDMDRLFEDYGVAAGWRLPSLLNRGHELLRREAGLIPADWSPRVEVLERDGQFVVRADLPGLAKENVHVDVAKDVLTIRGERKQETKEEHGGYAYSECSYGNFYRAIPIPEGVDSGKATAEFHNGVLEVVMPAPKHGEPQARRIEVQEKK